MPMTHGSRMRGFTLIELIVSMGIFALVMLVATSAYYNLIALDRKARSVNTTVNNLSFAVDAMTRGIRTGTNYQCVATGGDSVDGSCSCFTYADSELGKQVTYHLNATKHVIERYTASSGSSCTDGSPAITDSAVTISTLRFYVRGSSSSDDLQAQVLFTVVGTMPADNSGTRTSFTLEENASQRVLDL